MIAKFFLRYIPQFVYLRSVPILGDLLHWLSYRLLHPTKRIWIQVRKGIGKGLWLKLNPRTGAHFYKGNAELPVQETLRRYLRPGMVFYDIGSNVRLENCNRIGHSELGTGALGHWGIGTISLSFLRRRAYKWP